MKLLYRFGAQRRNPSMGDRLRLLKEAEGWSSARLAEYQLAQGKAFLEFVRLHSPYYRGVFKERGFDPSRMKDWSELRALPVVEKDVLVEHNGAIHTDYSFKRVFSCETSGTSGLVLTFRRNEEWDSANRAAVLRGYSWYGVQPWERNAYLWGYNIAPKERLRVKLLDGLQNRFRMFSYDPEEILLFAEKMETAVYLHGYSSMIYRIARALNENPDLPRPRRLKLVKGTSEKIFDAYQVEAKKAFGRRIVSEYGAAEAGLIAFECPEGNMHIHTEGCFVEDVEGQVVVTNFLSRSFPIIRYRLGDAVKLAPSEFECSCGMKHPVILEVMGRVGKILYGAEREYPSLTLYYVFKNLFFEKGITLSYQVIQEEKGKVTVNIEQEAAEHVELIEAEFRKNFGTDLLTSIRFGQQIAAGGGKRRDFISHLDD